MKTQTYAHQIAVLLFLYINYASSTPPHIIFIFVDDLGWNDVSFHGSTQIPTPNIDSLAYNGIILDNYYVQPICTPSRGSLMTGKYPIKLGLQHDVIGASERWGLSPKEIILPQHLKKLGYSTHGVGKWHLGFFHESYLPSNRGFDTFFGYWQGKKDFYTHWDQSGNVSGLDFHWNAETLWNYTGYYATEAFTEGAKNVILTHDPSKPLFLYVAHQAVHTGNGYAPLQAPKIYTDKFCHIKDNDRRIFAGMAYALDKSVGEIFMALDSKGMLENSIIVFSTDNGAAVEGIDKSTGSSWPLRGSKYNLWEGGIRGSAFIWSLLLPKGVISRNLMHISDWLPTLYAAAGGNPKDLGSIDGFNFWPSLVKNSSAPRDHILLNIDPVWHVEAIRKGRYKLLKGSVFHGKFDGWFDKQGKKQSDSLQESRSIQDEVYMNLLDESEVFKVLTKKFTKTTEKIVYWGSINHNKDNCESLTPEEMAGRSLVHSFSPPVTVKCGNKPQNASTNCEPMKEYCLFDIEQDPCEYNNIAKSLPNVAQELKNLLDSYRNKAVPLRNKPGDPMANPKYHGYAWVPWIKHDVEDNLLM